jgi:hypothetical protein
MIGKNEKTRHPKGRRAFVVPPFFDPAAGGGILVPSLTE